MEVLIFGMSYRIARTTPEFTDQNFCCYFARPIQKERVKPAFATGFCDSIM